jgi:hypothetical protein
MAGFLYIFSNPSIPGQLKIGKSDRDPDEYRRIELSNTSVPSDFNVEYFAYVENHHVLERALHQKLASFRTNPKREFFLCTVDMAISALQIVAKGKIKFEESRVCQPPSAITNEGADPHRNGLGASPHKKQLPKSALTAGVTLTSKRWSDKILESISYITHSVLRLSSGGYAVIIGSTVYVYESEHKIFSALFALNIFGAPISRDGFVMEFQVNDLSLET